MAVILYHFNWCKFYTPTRNLHRFIRQMRIQEIPVYGIELSLDEKFETTGMNNWKHITVTKENICFQKEACINIVVNTLPDNITKIAWIDHDLMFANQRWYTDASEKLETFKVVHLFSEYTFTEKFGRKQDWSFSVVRSNALPRKAPNPMGARGCAWAARRELWNNGGLYPFCFLGGGDSLFVSVILNFFETIDKHVVGLTHNEKFELFLQWKQKINNYIKPEDVSFINGEIIHEWHGDKDDRQYKSRYDLMYNLDISKILSLDQNGLIRINDSSNTICDKILNYFQSRNEDGLTIIKNS